MHLFRLIAFDKVGRPAAAPEKLLQFFMLDAGQNGWIADLVAVEVQDRQYGSVACIIGDGEAETGPLATSWQSNKLLDPISDGAVLPILHLNGYKISNPTVLARIEHEELDCHEVAKGPVSASPSPMMQATMRSGLSNAAPKA